MQGYAFAWAGHFFFERNKPATFSYPWLSFLGDFAEYPEGESRSRFDLATRHIRDTGVSYRVYGEETEQSCLPCNNQGHQQENWKMVDRSFVLEETDAADNGTGWYWIIAG